MKKGKKRKNESIVIYVDFIHIFDSLPEFVDGQLDLTGIYNTICASWDSDIWDIYSGNIFSG